jgi:hypothetical protein
VESAQQTITGESTQRFTKDSDFYRYVMFINEFQAPRELDSAGKVATVMLLSGRTDCLSNVDILLPAKISGLEQDLLCETWHVIPLLVSHLAHPVGQRLSRQIYDLLLNVGDAHHGLADEAPSLQDIEQVGLQGGAMVASHPAIQLFHQQEIEWSTILSASLAADLAQQKKLKFAEVILEEARQLEQELAEPEYSIPNLTCPGLGKQPISLTQWLRNCIEPEWHRIHNLLDCQSMSFGMALRNSTYLPEHPLEPDKIKSLIDRLATEQDESQRQCIVKQLGNLAVGCTEAIQAIANLLQLTQDDETLWTAIESLSRIDPDNQVSISRLKTVDLGMQVVGQSVRLVVSLFQKAHQQVNVLLRVYPVGHEFFLPADLKLTLLDNAGKVLREVQARQSDVFIQIKLRGYFGEQFSVQVALQNANITENFVI